MHQSFRDGFEKEAGVFGNPIAKFQGWRAGRQAYKTRKADVMGRWNQRKADQAYQQSYSKANPQSPVQSRKAVTVPPAPPVQSSPGSVPSRSYKKQQPAPTQQAPAPTQQQPAPTQQAPAPTQQQPAPTQQGETSTGKLLMTATGGGFVGYQAGNMQNDTPSAYQYSPPQYAR